MNITNNPTITMFIIVGVLILLGMIMEDLSLLVIMGPLLMPLVLKLGINPVHYGMIFGYDVLPLLANAIETAQSLDPVQIKDALKETDYRGLEGRIRFKEFFVEGYKNQGKFTPSMIRWKNGKREHLDIFLDWEE